MIIDGHLQTYTVYQHPADNPDGYSMTQWSVTADGPVAVATVHVSTLERARYLIPPGLVRLERDPNDDPVIVETWV